jgi:hypothetical protein
MLWKDRTVPAVYPRSNPTQDRLVDDEIGTPAAEANLVLYAAVNASVSYAASLRVIDKWRC